MADLDSKAALIAQLAEARTQISQHVTGLQSDLDVAARARSSFLRNSGTWLGGAAITGWLLARLPARKKKVIVDRSSNKPIKEVEKAGFFLIAAKFLFNLFRPALTRYFTQKILEIHEERKSLSSRR